LYKKRFYSIMDDCKLNQEAGTTRAQGEDTNMEEPVITVSLLTYQASPEAKVENKQGDALYKCGERKWHELEL